MRSGYPASCCRPSCANSAFTVYSLVLIERGTLSASSTSTSTSIASLLEREHKLLLLLCCRYVLCVYCSSTYLSLDRVHSCLVRKISLSTRAYLACAIVDIVHCTASIGSRPAGVLVSFPAYAYNLL